MSVLARTGSLAPRLAAVAVALLGAALIGIGVLQATVFAEGTESTSRLAGIRQQPVVVTKVGMLDLDGPRVRVDATAPGKPVFIGIGRAGDVEAYLGKVSRIELTGHDGEGALTSEAVKGESTLPDPAGVDVWVASVRGNGAASLSWPENPGQWRLVVATDGTAANGPASVDMTWTVRPAASIAPALVAVGLLLLVGGGVTAVLMWRRNSGGGDDDLDDSPWDPYGVGGGTSPAERVEALTGAGTGPPTGSTPAYPTRRELRARQSGAPLPPTPPPGLAAPATSPAGLPIRSPGSSASPDTNPRGLGLPPASAGDGRSAQAHEDLFGRTDPAPAPDPWGDDPLGLGDRRPGTDGQQQEDDPAREWARDWQRNSDRGSSS